MDRYLRNTLVDVATTTLVSTVSVFAGVQTNKAISKQFDMLAAEVYPKKVLGFIKVRPKKK